MFLSDRKMMSPGLLEDGPLRVLLVNVSHHSAYSILQLVLLPQEARLDLLGLNPRTFESLDTVMEGLLDRCALEQRLVETVYDFPHIRST